MKPETYQKIRQATEAQYEAARKDFNAAFEGHRKDTFPAPPQLIMSARRVAGAVSKGGGAGF